ncbi:MULTISPECIES: adenylyl-sulfate kinase [unclassified Arthrobacter]|uniref:adenylyl-sulfate kinase n=1 Tax=unclassified Arthrobacter TaxID=235627 RepID=UPI0014912CEC|nr:MULTISPECIES: adenylyl-sulfate kinase [unclassified Arthrobacter]MBE0009071.1 adenylyl-sulfate kinase [Arthrobacter sp. AET 35A]NOJ62799.1 adenylyl-sulfate kinase [Arthrobacter sp. 147(2020)]
MNITAGHTHFIEPTQALDGSMLDELELLLGGLYGPANGYCLPGQLPAGWPTEFTLAVPEAIAQDALQRGALLITDPDGTPLAKLTVTDVQHSSSGAFLAGSISKLQPAEHPPVRNLRVTGPLARSGAGGPQRILVAAFANPPQADQIALTMSTAREADCDLLLLAVVDSNQTGTRFVQEMLDSLKLCADQIPNASVRLLVLPADKDSDGTRAPLLRRYVLDRVEADVVLDFTTRVAERTPPPASQERGLVVLFTGFSGSGKSTLARELVERLRIVDSRSTTLLDGDSVRRMLSSGLGFSRADREMNVRRIGWVASQIAGAGGIAVCAPIAPYDSTRQEIRDMAELVGDFLLVHVSTPLAICEQRDRKGLYAKARAGLINEFTGIDSPYEIPTDPDRCSIDTSSVAVEDGVTRVLEAISLLRPPPAGGPNAAGRQILTR